MPNEMKRPCVILDKRWFTKKPFDAMRYTAPCPEIAWQLAQALNPPIKVTQAVLDAMKEAPEANFHLSEEGTPLTYFHKFKSFRVLEEGKYYDLMRGECIQADCPLALKVLLQFNTEGEKFDA